MPKANAASARAVQEQMEERGVIYSPTWGEWSFGDVVGVEGEAGIFTVMGFRNDEASLVGGPVYGQEQTREWRSFPAALLTKKVLKQGKRRPVPEIEED